MDLKSARKTLSGPLKFGDPKQIEAVNFIARAEACKDALDKCPHGTDRCDVCAGAGDCPHCGGECGECSGRGLIKGKDCHCVDAFDGDEFLASGQLKEEEYRRVGHPDEGVL